MAGYVKLHRVIEDNKLWSSEPFTKGQAWIDLLLMANYTVSEFQVRGVWVTVHPGEMARGEEHLAKKWNWSRNKVRRFLNWLETEQQIKQQKSRVITIISIVNWKRYQGDGIVNETTDETTDETTERQQMEQQKDIYKNVKEGIKKVKEVTPLPPFIKGDLWNDYLEMRKKIKKPATEKAKELAIKKLEILKQQGEEPNEVLQQSILNSWQGLFAVKDKTRLPKNEDTQFICFLCNKEFKKTDGTYNKNSKRVCWDCYDKEEKEEWYKLSPEEKESKLNLMNRNNATIPKWMLTGK